VEHDLSTVKELAQFDLENDWLGSPAVPVETFLIARRHRLSAYRIFDALMGARAGVIVSARTTSTADRVGLIAIRT
jgi:hypothetical protein